MIVSMALIDEPQHISLFEEIYHTYRSGMFRIANAVLHDHHWAEDAVSEAFLKIAKNMKKISSLSCQEREGYLVILSRNAALDVYRKRKKQEGPIDFIEDLRDEDSSYTIDETVFSSNGYQQLLQAIEELPVIYRDALELHYLYGHTAKEAAELLGVEENTVHARLSRGRKKLAEALAKKKEEEGAAP